MDLQTHLLELKSEYIRLQGDMEKLGSNGNDISHLERQLVRLEEEIGKVRKQLKES